jgi:hypothetical protein
MARMFARGRAFDRDQAGEREASGDRPRRLAMAERDAMRAACAMLDAAARSVNKRKDSVERARAFAAMRGQQLAKIDDVVLALTKSAAETARSYVSGNTLKPPIGLPELRRAHGARELLQAAFDLALRTVEAVEGELLNAEALAGRAKAAVVEAALGVLVAEAEEPVADFAQAAAVLARERGRLLELVSLLRSRGVVIPQPCKRSFRSPPIWEQSGRSSSRRPLRPIRSPRCAPIRMRRSICTDRNGAAPLSAPEGDQGCGVN